MVMAKLARVQRPPAKSDSVLNVAVAFQGAPERERAIHVCEKVNEIIGADCVHSTWWEIDRLIDSMTLYGAVEAATNADVLVVSLHTREELPMGLCAWVDGWILRREREIGALVSLIAVQDGDDSRALKMQHYLRSAANSARMDFLHNEKPIPGILQPSFSPAGADATQGIFSRGDNWFPHGGINE